MNVFNTLEEAERGIFASDEVVVFGSMQVADDYAEFHCPHQRNTPTILTEEHLRALAEGKIVAINVNGQEYMVLLKKG